jgi:hypothetical protein
VEVGEPVHEGEAVAVAVAVGVGVAVAVGVQLGVQVGLGVGVALGVAVAVAVAVAVWVGPQLDWSAEATPPSGPVNAIRPTETSRVAVPSASPASPTRCSFSQLLCRDRRTIVTTPRVVTLYNQVVRYPGHYINAQYPQWPVTSTITMFSAEH